MSNFLSYTLQSVPWGCTFALVAVGLVLTYRATGVFNFGFGAEAYAAGVIYTELFDHGVNRVWAAVIVVCVVAPVFGAVLEAGLFSRIPVGNTTAKMVTALGVMVVLPSIVQLFPGTGNLQAPFAPFFAPVIPIFQVGSFFINGIELTTVLATMVTLLLLMALLYSKRFGLPMRAAVESPKLLELTGVNSRSVLRSSWMVATMLAGLAGVLFAPVETPVTPTNYSIILVAAIAAAAVGALRSLPLAVVGGVALGMVQGVVQGYIPQTSVWYSALVPSLPFFCLLVLLLVHPGMRTLDQSSDPMMAVEPPPPTPALAQRPPHINRLIHRFRWILAATFALIVITFSPGPWIAALTIGGAYSVIFLSITLITGLAGQLSLAQAAFAGIGAATTAQLTINQHVPVLVAAVAGAIVAGGGGWVASLPALRLRGLPVTLLTLCLALLADNLLFPTSWIGGGANGLTVPRPHIFGIDFSDVDSKSFLLLVLAVVLAVSGVVHVLLRGTTGRALAAVHASPVGAASSGVAVRRLTMFVFFLSAAIAGIGGALFAMSFLQESPSDFSWFWGPTFLVIVVTVGATTVEGAIEAGFGYALIAQALTYLPSTGSSSSNAVQSAVTVLVLSFGAFTYASHPEGIVEAAKRGIATTVLRAVPANPFERVGRKNS